MYYDSIEAAIEAAPHCTHVLTAGPKWKGNKSIEGMYAPAYFFNDGFYAEDNTTVTGCRFEMSHGHWRVALRRTLDAAKKHTDQQLAAARLGIPAHQFLESGVKHMKDRASQRDAENGERSMRKCVEAFNALEGTNLTETQGWRFMVMLKMARSTAGAFTADDYEDMVAYAGLAGESASQEQRTK